MLVVNPPLTALDIVDFERPIDALPEVPIFDGGHRSVVLPLPVVFSPIVEAVGDSASDITARREQRDARRLFQGFEAADDGQQFEPLAAYLRLAIGDLDFRGAADRFEHETPLAGLARRSGRLGGREEQKMRRGHAHRKDRELGGEENERQTRSAIRGGRRPCPCARVGGQFVRFRRRRVTHRFHSSTRPP